ncbi:YbaY family lipoprotein [Pseudomarimonas arenosa]|uniref:YbaY family lipoprotein n=1 Tax=Pseudomarimonas arenosa TaxID=2774145 RepID=A0AAW3ZJN3_9GAMM|nr:YbaY family lipoprotein [Pseudomarimonas arenosa]MBD8525724.1 YbaY family lipoprotein [Pseudomarimonas arenosa]
MRAPLVIAISAALLIVGCGQQSTSNQTQQAPVQQAPAGPPPVPASATAVRGSLSIEGLNDLPGGLSLRLRLLDMSDPSIVPPVMAERVEPAPASLPYTYALPYETASVNPQGKYVIEAALLTGDVVLYGTDNPPAVLAQGAPDRADIALVRGGGLPAPNIPPADLLKQEFDKLERSIGGMKRYNGESIEDDITVGWDAFADSSGVRFARQVIDYPKTGQVSFRFAYKNGQPWVLVREKSGVAAHVGWGKDGSLVLNRDVNDKPMEEADIAELKAMAEKLYAQASAKVK